MMQQQARPMAPSQPMQRAAQPVQVQTPGTIDNLISSVKPFVGAALQFADAVTPVLEQTWAKAQEVWQALQPYHPDDFLPLIFGLVLIFFGGQFPVTIAAVEAFRLAGWDRTKKSLIQLWQQYKIALEANRKDNLIDDNNDGIPDVQQIGAHALVSRKVGLFLKSTDPVAVNEGLQGVAAGCSAVVATLRLQFAQTLTLGMSLGDVFTRTAQQVLRPALERATPQPYHKWIDTFVTYACRSVAVTIAWWCTRIISAMHSATRGAQILMYAITVLARRYNVSIPINLGPDTTLFPVICGGLGFIGLYCQLVRGFRLPFPLNLLFFPVRVLEWVLYYVLAYGPKSYA